MYKKFTSEPSFCFGLTGGAQTLVLPGSDLDSLTTKVAPVNTIFLLYCSSSTQLLTVCRLFSNFALKMILSRLIHSRPTTVVTNTRS